MTSLKHSQFDLRGRDLRLTASVGDITPVEGVPPHVKHQLEQEAMDAFLNEMLGGEGNKDARERFRSLWDVSRLSLHVCEVIGR